MRMSCFAALAVAIAAAALAGARAESGTGAVAKARLLMNSGIAHERLGQYETARADFTAALKSNALSPPDRVRAIFDRGVALDALGRTNEAIRDYSEAIRLGPRFAPALNNRANAYRRLGRPAEAKRDYLAALAAGDSAREYPYYGLGQIAEKLGDFDTARDYYNKALAANPAYALAAQSLTALNYSKRASIVLHPPPVKPAPPNGRVEKAAIEPASPAPRLVPVRQLPPKPEPRIVAQSAAAPVLRHAILDAGTKPAAESSAARIQLGAFRDQAAAMAGWNKIVAASGGVLQGKSPLLLSVDLPGKGRLWRLRVAVGDKSSARRLCAELATKGLACMPARD